MMPGQAVDSGPEDSDGKAAADGATAEADAGAPDRAADVGGADRPPTLVDAAASSRDGGVDGPTEVPWSCVLRAAPSGTRPAGCLDPSISIECRAINPTPTPQPCDLTGPSKLVTCIAGGYHCQDVYQCCGSQAPGSSATHCDKKVPIDKYGTCCYPGTAACQKDAECCIGRCVAGRCG
jgi:hypothetical protein